MGSKRILPHTSGPREVKGIKQRFFIVCLSVALAVALFSGVFAVMGWGSLLSEVGSAVIYPFQWVFSKAGDAITGFGNYFADLESLQEENDALREELESLQSALVDAEILADEQARLYAYLSMGEEHTDYHLCAAVVVASTAAGGSGDYLTELTLNKGTASGVEAGMPVLSPGGLVGVVVEAGAYHCRVSTILDTSVSVGAITTRASETGLLEGDYARVALGRATLRYMAEEADVAEGDVVVTGGNGSVYPYGIPIGRVSGISANAYSRTTEAEVTPFVDFSNLRDVVILTDFTHTVAPPPAEEGGGS